MIFLTLLRSYSKVDLDEHWEEVWEERSGSQSQTKAGHEHAGGRARLLPVHHLGPGHHADGAHVAVADTEQHHDHDVRGVALEQGRANGVLAPGDVAKQEQRQEDESKHANEHF